MPGIAMDDSGGISSGAEIPDRRHDQSPVARDSNGGSFLDRSKPMFSNHEVLRLCDGVFNDLPPELAHVTLGFFPFAQLIRRVVQQSWIELNDLLHDMGNVHTSQLSTPSHLALAKSATGSKPRADQSSEHAIKKIRLLEFAQLKRAEFIKLLVLSEWSKHADEVSRLIDIQAFIRLRYGSYTTSLSQIGNMKQDLIGAQLANPDLKTALEILAVGGNGEMPMFGFLSPDSLTPLQILKTLQRINKLIDMRLILHEQVPRPFRTYFVHDGRVTFIVPSEFEIDLSVAFEAHSTQFFFVDMRFLFSPSSFPRGRLRTIVDQKVNSTLLESGLVGCYNLLHNLVLTHKINTLFKQATELTHAYWPEHLCVELLHRTLIIHYWCKKPGIKSWIEIGVRGCPERGTRGIGIDASFLHLRWVRDNEEVDAKEVNFNLSLLDVESILFSVISLHITHILRNVFDTLHRNRLYRPGDLHLGMHASSFEPGHCHLDVQLTKSSRLRVMVEAITGELVFQVQPSQMRRYDTDAKPDAGAVEDIVNRISRLRCVAAVNEIECRAKAAGWVPLNVKRINPDSLRRTFPTNALRSIVLYRAKDWKLPWFVAFTSTMDGDTWWIVRLRNQTSSTIPDNRGFLELEGARPVTGWYTGWSRRFQNSSFPSLMNALAGMIMVQSNVNFLNDLRSIRYFPPAEDLLLQPSLRVPSIFLCFRRDIFSSGTHIFLPYQRLTHSSVKETLRISYRGIDQQSGSAITVVDGQLVTAVASFGAIYANSNKNIAFRPGGGGFSMIFSTPVGLPIIPSLLDRLHRIDNLVSAVEILKGNGFKILSLSPSKINFAYPAGEELRGSIKFSYSEDRSHIRRERPRPALTPGVLRPQLSIDFNHRNPQRRIRESLTSTLNFHKDGFMLVVELLRVTLPLLRALERICVEACMGKSPCFRTEFAARSAQMYQIRYPFLRYYFKLSANQRKGHVMWVLSNSTPGREKSKHPTLERRLRDQLYNSQGNGWRGINQGGIAYSEDPGRLISDLDQSIKSYIEQITQNSSRDELLNPGQDTGLECRGVPSGDNHGKVQEYTFPTLGHVSSGRAKGQVTVQQGGNASSGIDVITID